MDNEICIKRYCKYSALCEENGFSAMEFHSEETDILSTDKNCLENRFFCQTSHSFETNILFTGCSHGAYFRGLILVFSMFLNVTGPLTFVPSNPTLHVKISRRLQLNIKRYNVNISCFDMYPLNIFIFTELHISDRPV